MMTCFKNALNHFQLPRKTMFRILIGHSNRFPLVSKLQYIRSYQITFSLVSKYTWILDLPFCVCVLKFTHIPTKLTKTDRRYPLVSYLNYPGIELKYSNSRSFNFSEMIPRCFKSYIPYRIHIYI